MVKSVAMGFNLISLATHLIPIKAVLKTVMAVDQTAFKRISTFT